MQKKLSVKEIQDLTSEQAWEIVEDFGVFLEKGGPVYRFSDELPWRKSDILIALLKLIRDSNSAVLEVLCTNIAILDLFIPSPEEYQDMLNLKQNTDNLLVKKCTECGHPVTEHIQTEAVKMSPDGKTDLSKHMNRCGFQGCGCGGFTLIPAQGD